MQGTRLRHRAVHQARNKVVYAPLCRAVKQQGCLITLSPNRTVKKLALGSKANI